MSPSNDPRPLVIHVMYRFDTGGLENGIVNLINHLPRQCYRHAILSLTEITDFRNRIQRDDVEFIALHKKPGHGFWLYPILFRLFRRLRPAIVHTRNLAALEVAVAAWAAGVPIRIHGEHGWDVGDFDGSSVKYRRMRQLYRPFVTYYLALSRQLAQYLQDHVGITLSRMTQVYNGVDTERFCPTTAYQRIPGCPFTNPDHWIVGTVGRMQTVKDQRTLAKAFALALKQAPFLSSTLRLVMVGDGPLRQECLAMLEEAGIAELAWLPGARSDVPEIMRGLNCFVLPSLAEGISNTILEAMSSGLPVIATEVGGNADLVSNHQTGILVPPANPEVMAKAIVEMATSPAQARAMGQAGRLEAERKFSIQTMLDNYRRVYDRLLEQAGFTA